MQMYRRPDGPKKRPKIINILTLLFLLLKVKAIAFLPSCLFLIYRSVAGQATGHTYAESHVLDLQINERVLSSNPWPAVEKRAATNCPISYPKQRVSS
jgi:hypothetical protein